MSILMGNQQQKEIKTIRERQITVKLSDADCDRLVDLCGRYNLGVSELLENFIGDLVGGTYSNGSDERAYAREWFERCWFSLQPEQTLLNHLLSWGYEPEDYLVMVDEIKLLKDQLRYVINYPEDCINSAEEKRSLKEMISDLKKALESMQEDWHPDGKVHMNKEIRHIRKWKEEKQSLLENQIQE